MKLVYAIFCFCFLHLASSVSAQETWDFRIETTAAAHGITQIVVIGTRIISGGGGGIGGGGGGNGITNTAPPAIAEDFVVATYQLPGPGPCISRDDCERVCDRTAASATALCGTIALVNPFAGVLCEAVVLAAWGLCLNECNSRPPTCP